MTAVFGPLALGTLQDFPTVRGHARGTDLGLMWHPLSFGDFVRVEPSVMLAVGALSESYYRLNEEAQTLSAPMVASELGTLVSIQSVGPLPKSLRYGLNLFYRAEFPFPATKIALPSEERTLEFRHVVGVGMQFDIDWEKEE